MLRARIRNSISSFQKVGGAPPFSFGNALEFDGTDDFVAVNVPPIPNINNALSFWIKYNAFGDLVFQRGDSPVFMMYNVNSTNTSFRIIQYAANDLTVSFAKTTGVWYHYFIFNVGLNVYCYINGILRGTGTAPSNLGLSLSLIGQNYNASSFSPNVIIDEFAIWNGLTGTAQNAIDLYNGGAGAYANKIIANPTAYWRMNGTSGDTTAIDEQGTYNGTLNNFNTSVCWVAH